MNLLRAFDAVMREGSLTRAAERLGKSQPSISQAIAKLRQLTGDPLFLPAGRSIRPTQRALDMREATRLILEQADLLLSPEPAFNPQSSEREFRLALHEYAELLILPRLFARLEALQSRLRIRTFPWSGDTNQRILRGEVDLGFDTIAQTDTNLQTVAMVSEPYVCIVRRDHPCARGMDLSAFLAQDHAVLDWPDPHASFIDRWLARRQLARKIRVRLFSGAALMEMVKKTDLICTLSVSMAECLADPTTHILLPAPLEELRFVCFLKWHSGSQDDPAQSWLRRALFESLPERGRSQASLNLL